MLCLKEFARWRYQLVIMFGRVHQNAAMGAKSAIYDWLVVIIFTDADNWIHMAVNSRIHVSISLLVMIICPVQKWLNNSRCIWGADLAGPRNNALHVVHMGATWRIRLNDQCMATTTTINAATYHLNIWKTEHNHQNPNSAVSSVVKF